MGRRRPPTSDERRSSQERPEREVTIEAIGARGDGLAEVDGQRLFVPLTVPGDQVRVRLGPVSGEGRRGEVTAWLAQGPGRAEPACRHFGRCGGCTLQHLAEPEYRAWKREQVGAALTRALGEAGAGAESSLTVAATPPGGRRRANFAVQRRGGAVLIGFSERLSHRLVDLTECPVLAPELLALLPALRRCLAEVLPDGGAAEAAATLLEGGVDLLLIGPPRLELNARLALGELAEAADLGRLSWRPDAATPPEPVAARRPVVGRFGGVAVEPPPGGFLQASREGEAALIAAVLEGVGQGGGSVADLFAGCGTFSLPLVAAGWRVHAVDGNAPALAALARAARSLPGLSVETRDLGRRPMEVSELARFSAAVFDPPRAGAAAQAAALAASALPVVVAVSCNPASFARDARLLAGGGYKLAVALVVDQFLWSGHVELVAVFRRGL